MNRHIKQTVALSAFASVCLALGMGLSHSWVAHAEEDKAVVVAPRGSEGLPSIAEVAEKLNPTVVAITNTSFVKSQRRAMPNSPFDDDFFNWFFGPQGTPQRGQQQEEQRVQAGGSGVLISSDGEILTNHHVIEGPRGAETEIEVKIADGRTFKAKVLGKDKELDIALIKIEAGHLPFAKLGDSEAMRVGEWVVAIGNPLGLEHTVTHGIISAKGRSSRLIGGGSGLESFLQTDAAINRGNSGGPLLNLRGEVIGINTAIRADGQNIGFAVPINMVKRVLRDLRSGKPVSRGYLGISTRELDKEFQESLGASLGVVVSDVQKGQAADKAGVQRLDVITSVDGNRVASPDELVGAIAARRAGDAVKLGLIRDGKPKDITVTLGDRKNLEQNGEEQEEESAPESGSGKGFNLEKSYGFTVEALTPALRHQFGLPEERKGVIVTSVAARSKASDNLTVGTVISAVGKQDVASLAEFTAQVKKHSGKPLLLLVWLPRVAQPITVAIPAR